jgi:hypothetical protein
MPDRTNEAEASRLRSATNRRADRLLVHIARVETAVGNLATVDRLIVLNTALRNALDDDVARSEGRRA